MKEGISIFGFRSMNKFNKFFPSLRNGMQMKDKVQLNERYVIPMNRPDCWTNKRMQEPRRNFSFSSQEQNWNPRRSDKYITYWGMGIFIRKTRFNLCYNCRRP